MMVIGRNDIQLLRIGRFTFSPIVVTKRITSNKAMVSNDLLYNILDVSIEEDDNTMLFKVFSEEGMKCQVFEIQLEE